MQERATQTGLAGPTSADVQYGITCVGCHTPHDAGTVKGAWDEEFDAQLNNDASLKGNGSNVCIECHNGELPVGTQATPGTEIHHPMKEMMAGYGAIGVPQHAERARGQVRQVPHAAHQLQPRFGAAGR